MFHLRDGLFFQRIETEPGYGCGCVRIVKHESARDGAPVVFDMIIDASSWASIVSSMSALGESGTTHVLSLVAQQGGFINDSFYRDQPKQR